MQILGGRSGLASNLSAGDHLQLWLKYMNTETTDLDMVLCGQDNTAHTIADSTLLIQHGEHTGEFWEVGQA